VHHFSGVESINLRLMHMHERFNPGDVLKVFETLYTVLVNFKYFAVPLIVEPINCLTM